jgi:VWFA-related protein
MQARTGTAAIAAALLFSGTSWLSARQARPEQSPAFRTGVEVVTVDVGVVDKQGQPVPGLVPADFVVSVGGQPRRVVTAEFIDVASVQADVSTTPDLAAISSNEGLGIGRMFMFIADQNTLDMGSARQVARASTRFFTGLTFADRSALALLPVGPGVGFTWAHNRVRDAFQRVIGMGSARTTWEYGSLADARDIASSNSLALRNLAQRECGNSIFASTSGGGTGQTGGGSVGTEASPSSGATPNAPAGDAPAGGAGGSGAGSGNAGAAAGGGGGNGRGSRGSGSSSGGGFGTSSCARDLQMQAESAWRMAQMNSLSSITALRRTLSALANVRGDKTVILISGGWPLDERDETTLMSTVAAEAAAARATIFTIFVPTSNFSADRRGISMGWSRDQYIHAGPLETLAAMTGGSTFRAEVNADAAFERLRRELAGYYRIGVEKDPSDAGGKNRRIKVQVSRGGTTVRAREVFDVRTYEDRDWAARLASALDSPVPATGLGLRMTSYLTADPEDSGKIKMVLAGEASRLQPGEATIQVLVRDVDGKSILSGEKPLGDATGDALPFSAEIPVAPGSYIVRVAVMDSAGRVGSLDHRVEARSVPLGALTALRPLLVRVPAGPNAEPRLALDGVRQDERLALQVDLAGSRDRLVDAAVAFEIASTADGPALVHATAAIPPAQRDGSVLAQAVADVRLLPPGRYLARAKVTSGGEALGDVSRAFDVLEAPRVSGEEVHVPADPLGRIAPPRLTARGTIPPFGLDQVLAPAVLGTFLDRVAARPDAAAPAIRELLDRARTDGPGELVVPDSLAASAPVAAFLEGLSLLAQNKLDRAANAFRRAMNGSADFYPAMVYLGACYAAGGNDKEAAGAWRTALIKEGDTLALHVLLTDALLRQDRGDLALQTITGARARWPEDEGLERRFATAALLAGRYADGLDAVDDLVARGVKDEPSLALALLALYDAFVQGRPVQDAEQDRARMILLADAYRTQGGPSIALVDTWVAAATHGR